MTKAPGTTSTEMIALTKTQKERMKALGLFGDTYADILERLLNFWDEGHKKK